MAPGAAAPMTFGRPSDTSSRPVPRYLPGLSVGVRLSTPKREPGTMVAPGEGARHPQPGQGNVLSWVFRHRGEVDGRGGYDRRFLSTQAPLARRGGVHGKASRAKEGACSTSAIEGFLGVEKAFLCLLMRRWWRAPDLTASDKIDLRWAKTQVLYAFWFTKTVGAGYLTSRK